MFFWKVKNHVDDLEESSDQVPRGVVWLNKSLGCFAASQSQLRVRVGGDLLSILHP